MTIFLVVLFLNKIPLFSKDVITFIVCLISLLVRVIPKPLNDEIPFIIFLGSKLNPACTILYFYVFIFFIFLAPIYFDSFNTELINEKNPSDAFINAFLLSEKGKNPPDCIILDN